MTQFRSTETMCGSAMPHLSSFALCVFFAASAFSQPFEVPWSSLDGGGAFTTGGGFETSGTVGQPDASTTSGGGFETAGGFLPGAQSTAGVPAATITSSVSRKTHLIHGVQDLPINLAGRVQNGTVTSEARSSGLTELRITFDSAPGGPGDEPVTILQQSCPACSPACSPPGSQAGYAPYAGSSATSAAVQGNDLVLTFTPGLESARTYKLAINSSVTSVTGQSIEVRVMRGDINGDARTNGGDRSQVISVWTSTGFSPATDISLDGKTNGGDRSIIIGVWTSTERCAP